MTFSIFPEPEQLLAFAKTTLAPLGVTWKPFTPADGRPRIIGELPDDSGAVDIIGNDAQTAVVRVLFMSKLGVDNAQRFIFLLAKFVPSFTAKQAEAFLILATKQALNNSAESTQINHTVGTARIEFLLLKRDQLLSLTIWYQ